MFRVAVVHDRCLRPASRDPHYVPQVVLLEAWSQLTEERQAELAPHLANKMITHAKEMKLSQTISKKWNSSKREVNNNIMGMARYITEGILDAIE